MGAPLANKIIYIRILLDRSLRMACIHNQQKEQSKTKKKQHSGHLVPYNKIAL